MKNEFVTKSRIYFEGWLPGNIKRLKNEAFVHILGTGNNEEDSRLVDRDQLVSIIRRMVTEWNELPNTRTDFRLESALEQPDRLLEVVCPDVLYVTPDPMMLKCSVCDRLDYHRSRQNREEAIEHASRRIREGHDKPFIPCGKNGCRGVMRQMEHVAIHRCGNTTPIDIPFASIRVKILGYRSHGSSFLQSEFFDVDTGVATNHSLQMPCRSCQPNHERSSKQARPVGNPDIFHSHSLQYLCLKEEAGKLNSRLASACRSAEGRDIARDLSDAVVSTILGLTSAESLFDYMREAVEGGTDKQDIEGVTAELEKQRSIISTIDTMAAAIGQDVANTIKDTTLLRIQELDKQLVTASGRFSSVHEFFSLPSLIQQVGLRRRAIEAALLPHDSAKECATFADMLSEEMDPARKDALLQDASVLKNRYGVDSISHYKQLNVVMASMGYTRELAQPTEESGNPDYPPITLMGYEDTLKESLRGKTIIYALPARTEAIQVRLCPSRVLRWCIDQAGWEDPGSEVVDNKVAAHAHLLSNCPALSLDPAEVMAETRNDPVLQSAPFHLLHTISHCLLGSIKRHTGYDQKSMMEYLMPTDLSLILYVTSVQNYTSGGLLTLFRHHLRLWFDDASNYAFNCIFDPMCSDKGAVCSGCVQIVMGCETFNHGVSRSYIHGGKLGSEQQIEILDGYWQ
ncbi:hypothetical protein QFX18_10890 [Saccharophagus degradans]|uniref:hypothetical protein n=1 Tax=Saccharophagus degradans TaxID=86304 RepID=UPI002477E9D0|nr:hypothetical protein [Saccharophagus degradans]WGO96554.1 hypothetical protein QFX18_10890 [Saccharophagus degradans]